MDCLSYDGNKGHSADDLPQPGTLAHIDSNPSYPSQIDPHTDPIEQISRMQARLFTLESEN